MIADGLWLRRKDRRPRVFQPRPRRACLGELVQIDGSEHWWFEGRGPQCTLLVFIDDATSMARCRRWNAPPTAAPHPRATARPSP